MLTNTNPTLFKQRKGHLKRKCVILIIMINNIKMTEESNMKFYQKKIGKNYIMKRFDDRIAESSIL